MSYLYSTVRSFQLTAIREVYLPRDTREPISVDRKSEIRNPKSEIGPLFENASLTPYVHLRNLHQPSGRRDADRCSVVLHPYIRLQPPLPVVRHPLHLVGAGRRETAGCGSVGAGAGFRRPARGGHRWRAAPATRDRRADRGAERGGPSRNGRNRGHGRPGLPLRSAVGVAEDRQLGPTGCGPGSPPAAARGPRSARPPAAAFPGPPAEVRGRRCRRSAGGA